MPTISELREALQARPVDGAVNMAGYSTTDTPFVESKSDAKDYVDGQMQDDLFDRHELLYAEEERSILLVLQGLDCSGKNGTIKHVVIAMNPAGVRTASFKEPTKEELDHHFLWRYRNELPAPGQLGVFDRSHYEDVLVPQALGTLDEAEIAERMNEINAFEEELVNGGTTIIKCLLHISFDEQRERFLRRLRRDDKRWKFAESDLETRKSWNEFQAAYSHVVGQTSTDYAPWYVIPADHKWYRNWVIGHLIIATIDDMGPTYPQPTFDLEELRSRLAPPH
ncbi:MAG: polyphosphate kinase 2 family protein [Acidimicrobiales bacterium]|nr:polyphosphate kinase 2 family protein [Acidimicrobiales bacterium]